MDDSTEQIPPDASQPQPAPVLPDSFQQPGLAASLQPAPKSRRTLWIIIATVVLLLVLGAGIPGLFVILPATQESALEKTLQTYCNAYKHLDENMLNSLLSTSYKNNKQKEDISGELYLYEYLQIKTFGASFDSCTVSTIQRNGASAAAIVTILLLGVRDLQDPFTSPPTDQTVTAKVSLILENGLWNWKVNDVQPPDQ